MSAYTKPKFFRGRTETDTTTVKCTKKKFLLVLSSVIILFAVAILLYQSLLGAGVRLGGVGFTPLTAEEIPRTIEKDVIPEYRELERALGCMIDGKVYVIVTRGEKPSAGYELTIEKLSLNKQKNGSNLVVTALFTDPSAEKSVSRIITYPYAVAETDLQALPDTIELNIRYAE